MPTPAAEIRRRALLAAAKVTLSLSALACADSESPADRTDALTGGAGSPGGASTTGGAGGSAIAGSGTAAGTGGVAAAGAGGAGAAGGSGLAGQGGSVGGSACDVLQEASYKVSTVDCCTAQVASVLPVWSDTTQPMPDRPETIDQATLDCCKVLVVTNDASKQPFQPESAAWQQAATCCPYLPLNDPEFQGPTCTPWGPPMPPAMPLAWRTSAEARA